MRENEDKIIKRSREKEKGTAIPKVLGFCVLLLIAIMVISVAISDLSGVSLAEIGKSSEKGTVIYDSLPDSIKNIENYSSGLVMLTDTAVDYLDSSGKRIVSNSHQYSQPVMIPNKSGVLLYDKGGTSFRIEKNTNIYNTYQVSSSITTATMDKKGNYAYVLNEDGGFQSHLYVYSYKGKKLFEWGSAADYCITSALSDNGKNIVLAMLGVKNGEYISKVIFFNVRENEAVYTVEFPDCTVIGLEFLTGKNVSVITDNGIFVIDKKGEYEKITDYSSAEIMHSSVCDSGISSVATAINGNTKTSHISVFSKRFDELYSLDFDSEIYSVCTSDKYLAVILSDCIEIFDTAGEKTGSIIIDEKCVDTAFSGRTLFVLTVSGIYSFDASTEYDLTVINDSSSEDEFTKGFTEEALEETTQTEEVSLTEGESTETVIQTFG